VKVIDAIEAALELPQGELNLEREVLHDYGNMSAPTVLVRARAADRPRSPKAGDDDRLRPRLHLRRPGAGGRMNWDSSRDSRLCHARAACRAVARAPTRSACWRSGAREHGKSHYPAIFAVHAAWIITLWLLATGRGVDPFWLAMFVLLLFARFWVIATLGPRWTTRIIVVPDAPLVKEGPYRFLNHPNYWVVAARSRCFRWCSVCRGWRWSSRAQRYRYCGIRVREENRALAPSAARRVG
jgi:methyltransferase